MIFQSYRQNKSRQRTLYDKKEHDKFSTNFNYMINDNKTNGKW